MNSKLTHTFAFLSGAAIGSVVTWKLIKNRYKKIAQEEIDSVIAEFSNKKSSDEPDPINHESEERVVYGGDTTEVKNIIRENGYISSEDAIENNEKEKTVEEGDFYIITPAEAGDEYDIESLTYYAGDHVLTDEYDNIIELPCFNPEPHFGEYEDDAVHVRSDKRQIDYEIIRDMRSYSDVMSHTPHKSTAGND